LPVCGASKDYSWDDKQLSNGLTPTSRKDVAMAFKCPCIGQSQNSFGRYLGPMYLIADQTLGSISKATKCSDLEANYTECPWESFKDPLWSEVMQWLQLEDIPGTKNIDDNTDNIVYEAVLYYKRCFNNVDSYIIGKEMDKQKEESNKRQQASKSFKNGQNKF
jgi:hypothetical protein